MNSLHGRLSVALVVIVSLMGAAFYLIDRANMRSYYDELTQKLNAPIAMYVTGRSQLISDGKPDLASLRELAHRAMVINPTAEIYLLDTTGRILGHSLPIADVALDRVDLVPVHALVNGSVQPPVHGDDPRNPAVRKVFSAAEVRSAAGLEGYLYVVLGGRTFEQLSSNIGDSYIAKVSLVSVLAIVVLAAAVGLLVFGLMTRRLTRLRAEVDRVSSSGFEQALPVSQKGDSGDEIDALAAAFSRMAAQIRLQIRQLEQNDKLRRELVTNISHDLRTPLAAVQGYIETLLLKHDRMSNEERHLSLQISRKHAVRLGSLIGDLFELAKLDSATLQPTLEEFCLAELVQDVAQEFEIEAQRMDLRMEVRCADSTAITVGDIGLIQRALENLVRNAIRYTPAGGTVSISIRELDQSLAVAVSDNGPGIAESDVPRIFDRFYRSVGGEEAQSDSAGLGLAIVKRILDLHDTRITVSSKIDAGTRFEFELPRKRAAA